MAKVVIFGAGDIARLAHFYFTNDSEHDVVAFVVDAEFRHQDSFLDLPLVAFETVTERFPPDQFAMFVALSYAGINRLRAAKYAAARALGYRLVSYVSSRCSFLTKSPAGDNCFILEDNTIQPFVTIGSDVTLWSGNHIGHDSTIGDHTFISSHVVVSGHVHIEPGCFIGVNATLRNSITIGEHTLIGAGATIMKNTKPHSVYLGPRSGPWSKTSDQVDL